MYTDRCHIVANQLTIHPKTSQDGCRPSSQAGGGGKRLAELKTPGSGPDTTALTIRPPLGHRPDRDPRRHHCCADDLWIEEETRRKRKLAQMKRGSLGQLSPHCAEELDKVRLHHAYPCKTTYSLGRWILSLSSSSSSSFLLFIYVLS